MLLLLFVYLFTITYLLPNRVNLLAKNIYFVVNDCCIKM